MVRPYHSSIPFKQDLVMKIKLVVILCSILLVACNAQEPEEVAEPAQVSIEPAQVSAPESDAAEPSGPAYTLNQLDGDLYHATSDAHSTLVLLTSEGAILADPLNVGFAEWLKSELSTRFNTTVRYVLYSHHHWDHASGGGVFSDTAELVGHANMIPGLALPLAANYVPNDANNDSAIQRDEATGGLAKNFDFMDENSDGKITGTELNRFIVAPTTTYSGEDYVVTLGGKEVRMVWAGDNHSNDGSIIVFSDYNTAFGVDWLAVGAFPRQLYGVGLDAWVEVTDLLVSLQPARIVPGHTSHGNIGDLDDAVAYNQMFRDLRDNLQAAIEYDIGKDEFLFHLTMSPYSQWERYDTSLPAIAGQAYDLATK
jgi:glyoxylase-like metal-dependent hydrolase (beta-lactamase superfamily II)